MKLSAKIAAAACLIAGASGAMLTLQSANADAGKGMRTIYYNNSSLQYEVGFTMNRIGCGGGISTYGTVTPYKKVNSFICA